MGNHLFQLHGVWWQLHQHQAKLKTGRRRHCKANQQQQERVKNFKTLIGGQEVKHVLALDEGRFGLKSCFKRRWCPKGVRPPWIVEEKYEWLWLYAAVEPTTGNAFFLLLPDTSGDCFQLFLEHLQSELKGEEVKIVLDNAPSHCSQHVQWPSQITPYYLPAYSPELNPAEQLFREGHKRLSNTIFEDLEALRDALLQILQQWWSQPALLLHLTGYPWWVQALQSS
jgi:transposase